MYMYALSGVENQNARNRCRRRLTACIPACWPLPVSCLLPASQAASTGPPSPLGRRQPTPTWRSATPRPRCPSWGPPLRSALPLAAPGGALFRDPDSDPLLVGIVAPPQEGSATVDPATGAVVYRPPYMAKKVPDGKVVQFKVQAVDVPAGLASEEVTIDVKIGGRQQGQAATRGVSVMQRSCLPGRPLLVLASAICNRSRNHAIHTTTYSPRPHICLCGA